MSLPRSVEVACTECGRVYAEDADLAAARAPLCSGYCEAASEARADERRGLEAARPPEWSADDQRLVDEVLAQLEVDLSGVEELEPGAAAGWVRDRARTVGLLRAAVGAAGAYSQRVAGLEAALRACLEAGSPMARAKCSTAWPAAAKAARAALAGGPARRAKGRR